MTPIERYHAAVVKLLDRVQREEADTIRRAAGVLADVMARDRLIFVFGTGGHSFMAGEEMARRAGGLAPVYPILDPGISILFGPVRAGAMERTPGYARTVLNTYPITAHDALVIVNAYGINACSIDSALWARERAVPTIAITSPAFSRGVPADHPARHPSGKNLPDLVDHVIDNKMPDGDAVLDFEGLTPKVSPVSTILNVFILESLVAETAALLLARGITPPVWTSSNVPGGDAANRELMARFSPRIRWL
jgi:uncharacterized phosphosugar-binding protein